MGVSEVVYHEKGGATVTRHTLPNGTSIYFKDGPELAPTQAHSYWREWKGGLSCAGRIPGGSTISKQDGDGNIDPLLNWSARLTYEGVAREASLGLSLDDSEDIRQALSWLESAESIEDTLRQSKLTWRELRESKADIGTDAHSVLEALAAGATPILRNGYEHAAADWFVKRKPEVFQSEVVVYSERHGFAGTLDLRARPTERVVGPHALPDIDGAVVLLDAKSSSFISNSHHIQLALYELAAVECGIGASDERVILQLREDGSWHEWRGNATAEDALASLTLYKRGKLLTAAGRKAWRESKKALAVTA